MGSVGTLVADAAPSWMRSSVERADVSAEHRQLTREGHPVAQFKDAETNRFVAVAVDGKIMEYSGARGSDA